MSTRLDQRRCACGGVLVAEKSTTAIREAVQIHNRSALHVAWALKKGYYDPVVRREAVA